MKKKKVIGNICIVFAFFCFLKVLSIWMQYANEKDYYNEITETVVTEKVTEDVFDYPAPRDIDWDTLQGESPDIVAWIDVLGIDVGYPIVQSENNNDYLRKTPTGESASCGSIILNTTNNADFNDQNTVIFGHNMKNGTMFGKLKWFMVKDAYEKSPYIWINTPEEDVLYQIVSAYVVKISDGVPDTYDIEIEDYESWYGRMISLSEKEMEWQESSNMITLSTCNSNGYSYRTIVQAVEILRQEN